MSKRARQRPVACINCKRRGTTKSYHCTIDCWDRFTIHTWQCVYCGAIMEQGPFRAQYLGTDRIILAPGELEELRNERRN